MNVPLIDYRTIKLGYKYSFYCHNLKTHTKKRNTMVSKCLQLSYHLNIKNALKNLKGAHEPLLLSVAELFPFFQKSRFKVFLITDITSYAEAGSSFPKIKVQ